MNLDDLAWDHDDDGWNVIVCGACPVQGDGEVDGHPFYFRARGMSWSFSVVENPEKDPVDVGWRERGWLAQGGYGKFPDAGWMPRDHSREIVEACIRSWREIRHRPIETESGLSVFHPSGPIPTGPVPDPDA